MPVEVLEWISKLLEDRDIPYVICGGLAAIAYGSNRPLNDIDLLVPGKYFQTVVQAGSGYILKAAKHYQGEGWDIEYVQFIYQGTQVEVGNSHGIRILCSKTGVWVPLLVDFVNRTYKEVYGIKVPLVSVNDLISYKKILGRSVDIEDIEAIEKRA